MRNGAGKTTTVRILTTIVEPRRRPVLLAFPSSAFLLTKNMPGPLRAYADHQPLTAAVNANRPWQLGGPTASHAVAAIIWCADIVAVFAPLSVLRYRRAA
jgi:ABC-type branched-subunit amino acid transport system ATPase component